MPVLKPLTVRNQFPDYPISTLPDLTGFEDTSWGNDTCPSFRRRHCLVWVDWPDPADREDPDGHRFIVYEVGEDGALVDEEPLVQADDWHLVVHFIEND